MQGVVSLLDNESDHDVRIIWKRLERDFGLKAAQAAMAPHFSWHVAEKYPYHELKKILTPICSNLKPFKVKTGGLGMFLTPEPVLFIQIIVNQSLLDLHERIFKAVDPLCEGSLSYYHPGLWTPHITLAFQDLRESQLGAILADLHNEDFERWIMIDNFAIICPSEDGEIELCRMDFSCT